MKVKVQDGEVDLSEVLAGMKKDSGGNGDAVALKLLADNYKHRRTISDLKKLVPAEGGRVLTKDEAAAFEAYQKLGKLEEVKAALDGASGATKELKDLRREKQVARAARIYGFDPDVLASLAGDLEIEFQTVKQGEESREVALVKDGDQPKALDVLAAEKWPKFMASLKPESGKAASAAVPPAANNGTPWVTQNPGGKPPKGASLVQKHLERNLAEANAPNPNRPATPAKTGA